MTPIKHISEPDRSVVISFFATSPGSMPATKVFYMTKVNDSWCPDGAACQLKWFEVMALLRNYGATDIVLFEGHVLQFIPSV